MKDSDPIQTEPGPCPFLRGSAEGHGIHPRLSSAEGAGEATDWSDFKKILRYKGALVTAFWAVVLVALPGVWFLVEPEYRAAGKIRVRSVVPRMVFTTDDNGPIPYYEYYANTQADRVRSPEILQRVLQQPKVQATPWYRTQRREARIPIPEYRFVNSLNRKLEVAYKPKTEILEVAFTAHRPQDAAVIVNAVMEEYVADARRQTEQMRDRVAQRIDEEYQALRKQLAEIAQSSDNASGRSAGGNTLEHVRELSETFRTRLEQKEFERNAPDAVEIMCAAIPPSAPSFDRRVKLTGAVLLGAVMFGLLTAYVRGQVDPVIYGTEEIEKSIASRVLGQLPLMPARRKLTEQETARLSEAYRRLRTVLLKFLNGRSSVALAVTGAEAGVGKTSVAVMLARSLSQCGKKVLLVDANLRQPSVGDCFRLGPSPGLIGALINGGDDVVVKTSNPCLDVVPAGQRRDTFSIERLADGGIARCLERWRTDYEIILLDTPPVLSAADAAVISQGVDQTLMVVRERFSRRDEVSEACRTIRDCAGNLPGIICIGSSGLKRYHPAAGRQARR